jgi:hypothetical protein
MALIDSGFPANKRRIFAVEIKFAKPLFRSYNPSSCRALFCSQSTCCWLGAFCSPLRLCSLPGLPSYLCEPSVSEFASLSTDFLGASECAGEADRICIPKPPSFDLEQNKVGCRLGPTNPRLPLVPSIEIAGPAGARAFLTFISGNLGTQGGTQSGRPFVS